MERLEGESAGRFGGSCVCTHATHSDESRCAVSGAISTYSSLKVFGYILELAVRELYVVILILRAIYVSENFHRKEWI